METTKKLLTIAEMTKEHFANYPQQPIESIKEYLVAADANVVTELEAKFKENKIYYRQFQEAILHTSFIITVIFQKTINPEIEMDLGRYIREYLAFAQKDDKAIYAMRMYYLDSLNAEEMGIGFIDEDDLEELTDPVEKDLVKKEAKNRQDHYNNLLNDIKNKYTESKVYLA